MIAGTFAGKNTVLIIASEGVTGRKLKDDLISLGGLESS